MLSSSQKGLHSLLASNLKKLTITPPSSAPSPDFDFSEVFGPLTPHHNNTTQSPSSSSSPPAPAFLGDPQVIHNRSHSFVGPSPRYTLSSSLPLQIQELDNENENENENESGVLVTNISECKDGKEERKVGPGDFEILRVVGQGAFGKVFQVRKKGDDLNGDGIYAMKVMRKETIIKKNHVDYMRAERDILTKVLHPFIVQLRYSFQTKSKLYLILDFINGGHLFFHLYRQGIFSEDQARIYTAEIVSAVSHLHKCGIVHRDLKPENILMDVDGHVMLTDFGLAKEIDESSRSNSMCGTTEYMAPEILLSKGHNKDADWWSVGILVYEMLTGQAPFTHTNRKRLQQRIISEKVKLPPYLSSEAHSLLKGLLQKDPSKRLGSGPNGGDDIKRHKWFRSVNWKKLEARELLPKFKPDVSGKYCTANFDRCWTTMPPNDSPASTPTAGSCSIDVVRVAMNGKNRNSNKSLFENSMKMAVNMVKLSSFSIAKMSLGAAGPFAATKDFEPITGSMVFADKTLLSGVPQSQRSDKQWSSSKPRKFMMEPGGRNESAYVVQEENKGGNESSKGIDEESSVIDGRAAKYIEKVHKKNRDNFSETSILSPDIIPPPPLRALMMEPPKSLSY